jgi:hypothetical protein
MNRVEELRTEYSHDPILAALLLSLETITNIMGSRKGSIGSIDNVYLPQLNREHIDELYVIVFDAISRHRNNQEKIDVIYKKFKEIEKLAKGETK